MKIEERRRFLRQIGLAVGALTFGAPGGAAVSYQKKPGIQRAPAAPSTGGVDFRYAPADWVSPLSPPGGTGRSLVGRSGAILRGGGSAAGGRIALSLEGAGEITGLGQRCEAPHIPIVTTSVSYGGAGLEMTAFSTAHEDEGEVDTIRLTITGATPDAALRVTIDDGARLTHEIERDDDLPNGALCSLRAPDDRDRLFLLVDGEPSVSRDGDSLTLRIPAGAGSGTFHIRIPAGRADGDDVAEGIERLEERSAGARERWTGWLTARGPSGWNLPGVYGEFAVASARILDQAAAVGPAAAPGTAPPPVEARPDLVGEHFIAEAELYLGREKDARSRIEAVWSLQDEAGLLIGSGGEGNMKEMCAAVYSLCRYAELTGDWTMFDEYYPDAFNLLDALKLRRDKAAARTEKGANASRELLPEGSPGPGWEGAWEEMTNSLWALIALKPMLEISDRHFLMKKSEIREFYGQLKLACNVAARDAMRTDPAGHSWFPVVGAPVAAGSTGAGVAKPQAGLGVLSQAIYPGLLYGKDDRLVKGYPGLVAASLAEEIPSGTGPGGSDDPLDAALAAQAHLWFMLPGEARRLFIGFLNHAAPVFVWPARSGAGDGLRPDPRASAECLRFLRHAMVLEDDEVLRLFEGIGREDLAGGRPLVIDRTPTRWGRVSAGLEPVDSRTWKVTFSREPVNPEKGPGLKSVEMPRVLGPNFRFDTISQGSAIKNGPRVIIDAGTLKWEAFLRDLRRSG